MIELKELSFRISGRTILRHINMHVEKGETLAIMGLSGAGKSTILKCMAGLIRHTTGHLMINGTDITCMKESQLNTIRKKMGMVFQYAALFDSLNVYENVAFGLRRHTKMTEEEIENVVSSKLTIVGLPRTEHLMPSELSGGMQKRVGLARALAMEPEVIFYDEPTAGLDPITSATIAKLIIKARNELGITSVVVSHDLSTIRAVSNRIAMLHNGKIVAIGSNEEMENSNIPEVVQFLSGSTEGPIQITR